MSENPVLNPNSDEFLSPEERVRMRRMLMFPEEFPPEFKNWLLDYVGINGILQRSQVQGLLNTVARTDVVPTTESTTNTSYTNLATTGPEITGLAEGLYLILIGHHQTGAAVARTGRMSISINGAAADDNDSCSLTNNPGTGGSTVAASVSRALLKTVSGEGDNNSIRAVYKSDGGATVFFKDRFITVLRVN